MIAPADGDLYGSITRKLTDIGSLSKDVKFETPIKGD
jgi:hypothetical protein